MKLVRWLVSLALIAGLVFVAVEVPLGDKTLVDHVRSIAGTREGQQLVDGVKQRALEVKDRATGAKKAADADDTVAADDTDDTDDRSPGPGDDLTEKERRLLRKLIRQKLAESPPRKSGQGDPSPPE